MADVTPQPEDPVVTALREVRDSGTVKSVKQTILTCMIIRSVRPRRTRWPASLAAAALTAITVLERAHIWPWVAHLMH
jgi:hypothetical protein